MTKARLLALRSSMAHGEDGPLGSHRTATYAAVQSMPHNDPGSAAQVPTDDAQRPEYVAACHQRRGLILQLLRKRRHRGRYRRMRDASDGRGGTFGKRRRSWMRIGH
jgi:hypothetical protein